eukprot:TRINITY_DN49150_c0_g1_i1.p1 TRINITY_DN49150_c0_g1~~TRINITY_DN49150_c0_g1_i1.p1  ORF type:complete len:474 (+),score=88.39 TRINITY_DN49150_c0_g1_i1:87-1508(+)
MPAQKKRFTPVQSDLSWETIRRLASGCQGEYASGVISSKSIRLQQTASLRPQDPVEVLQTGVYALYYNTTSKAFESRVLKIDKQLSFLYALQETSKLRNGGAQDPFAVRLYEIEDVQSGRQARKLCQVLGVEDDYLTDSTAVAVFHAKGSKDMSFASVEKVMILIVSPQMKLPELLKGVVGLAKKKFIGGEEDDEEGLRLKDVGRYLDAARISKVSSVFTDQQHLDLEITLRSAEQSETGTRSMDKKKPIAHAVHFPLQPNAISQEITKLMDRLGILPKLDVARLNVVLYEMAIHRQWFEPFVRLFPGGLYDFMQDRTGISAHFKLGHDVQNQLTDPAPQRRPLDVDIYCAQALRGTVLAVKHLLDLERVFASAEKGISTRPKDDILKDVLNFNVDESRRNAFRQFSRPEETSMQAATLAVDRMLSQASDSSPSRVPPIKARLEELPRGNDTTPLMSDGPLGEVLTEGGIMAI